MTDFRTPPAREPGPQPDPMLQPGRRGSGWVWLFGVAIIAIIAATLYGINNQESQTASNEPASPAAQGDTTGAAPKDQQADQQNGQAAQKPAGDQKGGSPNSPNNTAPQKQQGQQTNQQPPKQQ